jgi:hypothetical protein
MSNRFSSDLIQACRRAAKQPILERLRFYERLQPLDVDQVDQLFAAVDRDADADWIPAAFAQLVPPIYWLARARDAEHADHDDDAYDDDQLEGAVTWRLGERWIRILLGALTTGLPPSPILGRLHSRVVHDDTLFALFEPVWPRITQLAQHEDLYVRYAAARIALLGKRITPAVTAALGELVATVTADVDDDDYDQQVFGESLLIEIGKAGPLLSALAPRLDPLLGSSGVFCAAAAQAAGAIGEPQLIPVLQGIERFEQAEQETRSAAGRARIENAEDEFRIKAIGAMRRLALWQLTGELDWLGRALDDAEGSLVYTFRLYLALENAPVTETLLAGLAYTAQRASWYAYACNVLAKIGPRAASTTAQLPPPPDDHSDTLLAYHHARWRAGLIDGAQLVAALQPLLASAYHAWEPYVATALATPAWAATIRAAIGTDESKAVLEALVKWPLTGVAFVADLIAAGRDDTVDALWCALPAETFWAHAQP